MLSNFVSPRKSCCLRDVEKYCGAREARDDNIIWRIHFARWITKATDTNSEYVILIAFPWQQCLHQRALILRYSTLRVFFFF